LLPLSLWALSDGNWIPTVWLSTWENNSNNKPQNPDMMGMLSSMLDSNKDGSMTDDLARIAGNFFK
jgi:hypothetical protein